LNGVVAALYAFFVEKLPYITIAVFFVGVAVRLRRWLSAPRDPEGPPFNILAALKYVILDVVLFRKTFKSDRWTWVVLVLFHVGVGGILFGHMRIGSSSRCLTITLPSFFSSSPVYWARV
jgi:nitrate reductase gamma subunit